MAEKNTANIGFEKQIWDAACVLWGHIPAAEYKKVIVGLIFLRYISSAFEKRYNELVAEGDGFEDEKDAYLMENIFFVPEEARWATISAAAHKPEIGTVIDNAMRAIENENSSLKNVLPKNYASPDLDQRVLGDVFAAISQLEREQLKQRQREGIEIAKTQGKYTGRNPIVIDWTKFGLLYGEWKSKNITGRDFMRRMGLSANTFYRRMREYEAEHGIAEPTSA